MNIEVINGNEVDHSSFSWLKLSVWFGLLTGFGELAALGFQKYILSEATFLGRHVIWMSPTSDLMIFLLLGGLTRLIGTRWRWQSSINGLIATLSFFTLTSWLLMFPRLQTHAVVVLAAGASWRLCRWVKPRLPAFLSFVDRTTRWSAPVVVFIAAASLAWGRIAEKRALAHYSSSSSPNILLIVLDTVRAESLSAYGYKRPTSPNLERLAQKGVLFEQAVSTAPWTITSHASIFTGRLPHELSADWDSPLDAQFPTLAESLRDRGYATAGFVGNTIACNTGSGLARGFAYYEDFTVDPAELLLSSSICRELIHSDLLRRWLGYHQIAARKSAAQVNADFLGWLERKDARPFFVFLNYFDAHEPYLPPSPYDHKFGLPAAKLGRVTHRLRLAWRSDREKISPEENRAEINAYDGALAYLDAQVGALMEELGRRGALQNTLVIITSDHGEAFGEHGHYTHGDTLYLNLLHVPLLIVYPNNVPAGKRIVQPVSLRDLPASVMDLLKIKTANPFPGQSLARYWDSAQADRSTELIYSEVNVGPLYPHKFPPGEKARMRSLISGPYHYIKGHDGREELYDFTRDPQELNDLSKIPAASALIESLRQSLGP